MTKCLTEWGPRWCNHTKSPGVDAGVVVGDGLVIPTVVVVTANEFNKNIDMLMDATNIGRKARGELGQLLTVI